MTRVDHNPAKGVIIAGLSGGSGKSVIAVGVTAALAEQGLLIAPFKKGPDYIDAGWMQIAAGTACHNLDPYLMTADTIIQSCFEHSKDKELVLIEGNRGLFDGVNVSGAYSTAELAAIIKLPVILVVDCTKTTRTVAAMLLGCQQMGKNIHIAGVILNRIGSRRHESIIRQSIEHYTNIKVLGALPRLRHDIFPQRHIGITPFQEFDGAAEAIKSLAAVISDHINLESLKNTATPLCLEPGSGSLYSQCHNSDGRHVTIGVLKDTAFQFYYPENLHALELCGAKLVEINALAEPELPDIDGLYIGGGFPETSAQQLSENSLFRQSLKRRIDAGLPVYAECGGLIYLGENITVAGETFPLTGIFPVSFSMAEKPQAHGYTVLKATHQNPFYPEGTKITGHEFRYSKVTDWTPQGVESLALTMERGTGFAEGKDGLVYKNVLALYTHIHALSTPEWAPAFIARVKEVQAA